MSEPIDDLIDSVARGMTRCDPATALGARVMAGLGPQRAPARAMTRWMMAGAAAAAVLLSLFIWRAFNGAAPVHVDASLRPASATAERSDPRPPVAAADASAGTGAMGRPRSMRASIDSPTAARIRAAAVPQSTSIELAWRSRAVRPLDAQPAIALDDIQPRPLAVPLLGVTPLAVAPISLPPLAARDRADVTSTGTQS